MAEKMEFVTNSSDGTIQYFADSKFVYAKQDNEVFKLAIFDKNFYKLRIVNGVPILEIDGLRMHLIKDFKTPLDYCKEVVKTLNTNKYDCVLDTCTGLGYIAIEAAENSKRVVTCEMNGAVLSLAGWNPWSEKLFNNKKIELREGDIGKEIYKMKTSSFSVIIHDPPRFSKAGYLYSAEFYKEMMRVAKKGARLFHYVGSVGKERGREIDKEVSKRLREAGFTKIKYNPRLQGIVFQK